MISFFSALAILLIGYIFYGRLTEKIFEPDERTTPAINQKDGVDFVPIPKWKAFLIQLLNIAGTGPIFGAWVQPLDQWFSSGLLLAQFWVVQSMII